jgi:hypothetical protein
MSEPTAGPSPAGTLPPPSANGSTGAASHVPRMRRDGDVGMTPTRLQLRAQA